MEQMVWNREWGGVRGRVWNRWCRIVSGVRCEVVYVTGGVGSCMGVGCDVVYGTDGVESCIWDEMRGRVWARWCQIVYGVRCEVGYGTGGVKSCMGVGCDVVYGIYGVESCIRDDVRGRVWNRWCRIMYGCEM
jgi:hypothetical protein